MIQVPEQLGPGITFRWFVEYVVDNSPLFRSSSAIAKASLLLAEDLDTVGKELSPNESALKHLREAVLSEEHPLPLPELIVSKADDPNSEPVKLPPRIYTRFISAITSE